MGAVLTRVQQEVHTETAGGFLLAAGFMAVPLATLNAAVVTMITSKRKRKRRES